MNNYIQKLLGKFGGKGKLPAHLDTVEEMKVHTKRPPHPPTPLENEHVRAMKIRNSD